MFRAIEGFMGWLVDNQELLLECNGEMRRVEAKEIWASEKCGEGISLPLLETAGLYVSYSLLEPQCILKNCEAGDFGELEVRYRDTMSGEEIVLSASHLSDHVVVDDEWIPIDSEKLEAVREELVKRGLDVGAPLSAKEYMLCIRDFVDEPWFVDEFVYDAKEWTEKLPVEYETRNPVTFTATLSDYQVRGSNWLSMMIEQGVGTILGDGMGLGKTIQAIKTVCDLFERKPDAHVLIVCPSALIENWCREFDKFTKGIHILRHVGPDRTRNYRLLDVPVVITTYDVVTRDYTVIGQREWDLLIIDEAQYIKSPHAQRTRSLKAIPRKVGLAMTGTPFENHMTDIWSIMDFCLPGFLGSENEFLSRYGDDIDSAEELGGIIRPLMLRRRLCDIPNDLPELHIVEMPIALAPEEAMEYERRKEEYRRDGSVLGAISKLKSELAKSKIDPDFISMAKYEYLSTVVSEILGYGEKIIVFAETYDSIGAIERMFGSNMPIYVLTGQVAQSERQLVVDEFSNEPGAAMLICNPTVGGAGLNITAANHVFHFACQWNPAKIDQADARAHRRGQQSIVTTHYPYYALTIEEYMWDKVQQKRVLSSSVVTGNDGEPTKNELLAALSLDPTKG